MMTQKRFPRPRPLALVAPIVAAAVFIGCGSDSSTAGEEEHATTPQQAVAEIGEVRSALAAALTAYAQGEAGQAEQLVGDAYLEHFELVEGPLEERDHELNEELEALLATEVRQEIERGASRDRVEALVGEADRKLGQAEKALQE